MTLFDYDKAEQNALIQTFALFGLPYRDGVRLKYREINDELWRVFERRQISKDDLQIQRFSRLFDRTGISCDAGLFNGKYLVELGRGNYLIDGAHEICEDLYGRGKKIYIVINGVALTQKMRVGGSAIKKFISGLFVSEDIGAQKPEKQYFDCVFARIEETDKSKMIIVGDSLTVDIQGGYNAGIDTCWFNPEHKENFIGIKPTYEITKLSEILQ